MLVVVGWWVTVGSHGLAGSRVVGCDVAGLYRPWYECEVRDLGVRDAAVRVRVMVVEGGDGG